jgi:hypothetical protein
MADTNRPMTVLQRNAPRRNFLRAFLDYFILFSGVSTASNLARTQGRPLRMRGIFLFRTRDGR